MIRSGSDTSVEFAQIVKEMDVKVNAAKADVGIKVQCLNFIMSIGADHQKLNGRLMLTMLRVHAIGK